MLIRFLIACVLIGLTTACSPVRICPSNPTLLSLDEILLEEGEGAAEHGSRPFLGVGHRLVDIDGLDKVAFSHGYRVDRVVPGSTADRIGLRVGDIIVAFDGISLDSITEADRQRYFSQYIRLQKEIGDPICLKVVRQISDMKVKGYGETIYPRNKKELEALIQDQPPDRKIKFTINNKVEILNLDAVLGARKNLTEKDLPSNRELFPEYENETTHHAAIMKRLLDHYDLRSRYEEIISRYSENELWDDGFRLNLFRYLHRDPFKLIPVVEKKTALLEDLSRNGGLASVLREGAGLLDEPLSPDGENTFSYGQQEHLKHIQEVVNRAWELRQKAFAQISGQDLVFLEKELILLMDRFSQSLYIDRPEEPDDRINNSKIIELARQVDFSSLFLSALALAEITDLEWLTALQESLDAENLSPAPEITGVSGTVVATFSTRAGSVVIGGTGRNIYKTSAAVIIDLGGDDQYLGDAGLVHSGQQISAIIDLAGNDEYLATELFAQGSGILGVGLLNDLAGDDLYVGTRFSQGSAAFGVGMLWDREGNDRYFGEEFNQGAAFWGAGILLDAKGNDYYHSNLFAQGVGGVKGFGALLDNAGDDYYFAGGRDKSSYGTSGIFKGSSQGLGIGFRGYTSGGIGLLLDGNGNDSFWAGNFSQGTGYFFGMGIIRNFGAGDDSYTASRYGQGASAHSAAGILIDDGGNDRYNGYHVALQGAAWDLGIAALVDKAGNDTYHGLNWFSQAASAHNGMAIFIDDAGLDQYFGEQARAENNDYHGGASLSFFIDGNGDHDMYSSGANNAVTMQGEYGVRTDLKDSIEKAAADEDFIRILETGQ